MQDKVSNPYSKAELVIKPHGLPKFEGKKSRVQLQAWTYGSCHTKGKLYVCEFCPLEDVL